MIKIIVAAISSAFYQLLAGIKLLISDAREPLPKKTLRAEDILETSPHGAEPIKPTTGPIPRRPLRPVPHEFKSVRTQALARKAALFLFEQNGFEEIPGHFWQIFEESYDPGRALEQFLRAIGCKPELIRCADVEELDRARTIINLLTRSGYLLHELAPKVRTQVGNLLQSGDYDEVKSIAAICSHLRNALDAVDDWRDRPTLASFDHQVAKLREVLKDPLDLNESSAEALENSLIEYAKCQHLFDQCCLKFERYKAEIISIWPASWSGTHHEKSLRDILLKLESVRSQIRENEGLLIKQLSAGLEHFLQELERLGDLIAEAHVVGATDSDSAGGSKEERARTEDSSRAYEDDQYVRDLEILGLTKETAPKLYKEFCAIYKARMKKVHPDWTKSGDHDKSAQLNGAWERIKKRRSWK